MSGGGVLSSASPDVNLLPPAPTPPPPPPRPQAPWKARDHGQGRLPLGAVGQ